eukprot:Nk52_evm29s233 gene=Nk52_evmTU29s233
MSDTSSSFICHVLLIDFHHTKGPLVEYAYPPLAASEAETGGEGSSGIKLPPGWAFLPFLCLPDGAHKQKSDCTYFVLPNRVEKEAKGKEAVDVFGDTVYGVAVHQQMGSEELLTRSSEVTRNHVQKSVCVLCRLPLFALLKARLEVCTDAFFAQRDFSKSGLLQEFYESLCHSFSATPPSLSMLYMDIPIREWVLRFRHKLLSLVKLLLLEKRVVVFGSDRIGDIGGLIVGLLSLFPGMLEEGLLFLHGKKSGDKLVSQSHCSSFAPLNREEQERLERNRICGLPFLLFSKEYVLHPYLCLQHLDVLKDKGTLSYLIGASNSLFRQSDISGADVIVMVDTGELIIEDPSIKEAISLSVADWRFIDTLIKQVQLEDEEFGEGNESSNEFEHGDAWVRGQFEQYFLGLIGSGLLHRKTRPNIEDPKESQRRKSSYEREAQAFERTMEEAERQIEQEQKEEKEEVAREMEERNNILEYGKGFVNEWLLTRNYHRWTAIADPLVVGGDISGKHPCAGSLQLGDIGIRLTNEFHGVGGKLKDGSKMLKEKSQMASKVFGSAMLKLQGFGSSLFNELSASGTTSGQDEDSPDGKKGMHESGGVSDERRSVGAVVEEMEMKPVSSSKGPSSRS